MPADFAEGDSTQGKIMKNQQVRDALLVNAKDAARMLAISPRKLWALTASGDLPHLRIGRLIRYPSQELERWVERKTTQDAARERTNRP